ncbi:hypothetical protein SASPL_128076 [Salvia splendens]|uniref:Glucuronoxylan 4-O-methyltransferase n=1 Tax=Salvia splendens TaxID=180675 RepID=A0A8X8XC06_SALSN|nr:hypothetical protein SASPL_128076 [Salvia splendens]
MQLPSLRIGPRQLDVDIPQLRRPDRLPRIGQGVDRTNQGADPVPEAYHVTYDTKVSQADELLEVASREECRVVSDPRFSKGQLALSGFPSEVYDVEWDLIMVDAPTGYFDGAPGRMSAIYTAGLMARNRESSGEGDVSVHDVDRVVEDRFSKELLCEGYLAEQEGRIRHFNIPNHRTSSGRPFCP